MVILRRIFPKKSTCPKCGSTKWRRVSQTAGVELRSCLSCGSAYRVQPAATEVDDGGKVSVVVPR